MVINVFQIVRNNVGVRNAWPLTTLIRRNYTFLKINST